LGAKVKVQINNHTLRALSTPAVVAAGEAIALAAGAGFAFDLRQGKTRPHGVVKAVSIEARRRNLKHNTLLKSVGAGRS
jgi:hypothetical protein